MSARPHPKRFPGLNDIVAVSVTLLEAIVVINIVNFLHSGRRTCQGGETPGRLVHCKIVVQEIDVRRLIRTTLKELSPCRRLGRLEILWPLAG